MKDRRKWSTLCHWKILPKTCKQRAYKEGHSCNYQWSFRNVRHSVFTDFSSWSWI